MHNAAVMQSAAKTAEQN